MRTSLSNDLKLSFVQPLILPAPKHIITEAPLELPAPKGGAKLDGIRRHITALRDSDKATKAALLGLVAIPTAIVSFVNPSPAAATTGHLNEDGTALASATLFSMPKVQLAKDDHEVELVTKISALVQRDFHGNTQAAFNHYAGADHQVSRSELLELLSDAGIGNVFTRGAWASGIMDRLDKAPHGDGNGKISWTEFNNVIGVGTA